MGRAAIFKRKRGTAKPTDSSEQPTGSVSEPVAIVESTADPVIGNEGDTFTDTDTSFTDPASIGDSGDTSTGEQQPRKRGRKPGSKNKPKAQQASDLTGILFSIHAMGSVLLKTPELQIEEEEAKRLSEAINRVQELYEVPILTEKQLAWINLTFVAGGIYGKRVIAISNSRKKKPKVVEMQFNEVPQPTQGVN